MDKILPHNHNRDHNFCNKILLSIKEATSPFLIHSTQLKTTRKRKRKRKKYIVSIYTINYEMQVAESGNKSKGLVMSRASDRTYQRKLEKVVFEFHPTAKAPVKN